MTRVSLAGRGITSALRSEDDEDKTAASNDWVQESREVTLETKWKVGDQVDYVERR